MHLYSVFPKNPPIPRKRQEVPAKIVFCLLWYSKKLWYIILNKDGRAWCCVTLMKWHIYNIFVALVTILSAVEVSIDC